LKEPYRALPSNSLFIHSFIYGARIFRPETKGGVDPIGFEERKRREQEE
jgi:hypothetical protein